MPFAATRRFVIPWKPENVAFQDVLTWEGSESSDKGRSLCRRV